jgi:hypothetical protein
MLVLGAMSTSCTPMQRANRDLARANVVMSLGAPCGKAFFLETVKTHFCSVADRANAKGGRRIAGELSSQDGTDPFASFLFLTCRRVRSSGMVAVAYFETHSPLAVHLYHRNLRLHFVAVLSRNGAVTRVYRVFDLCALRF